MGDFLSLPLGRFIEEAASGAPTPGGGGVAALAGALGGAMASMAANFTLRPKYAEHEARVRETLARLAPLVAGLQEAVDADAEAFARIGDAYRLPKETDSDREARKLAVEAALTASMRVPARVAADSLAAAELLPALARIGNRNLLSDVEVAAIMLAAAARAARVNVRVNSSQLASGEAREAERSAAEAERRTADIVEKVAGIIAERDKE